MSAFPYKTVWKLAAPNIASNILAVSTMIAHMYIVAPLGADASAAVVAGTRINFLLMAAGMALSVATTALVARAWGAQDYSAANKASTSAVGLSLIIATILAIPVLAFPYEIAALFSDDAKVIQLSASMMRPTACLSMIYAITLALSTSYRAIGNVIRPLKMMVVSSAGNIFAAYCFATGSFGLPALGPSGIPTGAAVSQVIITAFYVLIWSRGTHEIKPDWGSLLCLDHFKRLTRVGIPSAFEQYIIQIGSIIIMIMLASYGTAAFVAYGIGINILSVCTVIGMAFGTAGASLSGQRLGAGDPVAARQSGYVAMRLSLICMTIFAVVFIIFRHELSFILTEDPDVAASTQLFILILAICQPFMAIEFSIGGTLRGAGDTQFPMAATMVGTIGGRVIMGMLCLWLQWPLWVMYSLVVLDFALKAVALLWRVNGDKWMKQLDQSPPIPLQSAHCINRTGVREYYRTHPDLDVDVDVESEQHAN